MATFHHSHKSLGCVSAKTLVPRLNLSLHSHKLSNPGELLKTSRSPKLLCSDLWSRRMQQEVVAVMVARGELPGKPKPLPLAPCMDSLLHKAVRARRKSPLEPLQQSLERQLSLCETLRREVHKIRAEVTRQVRPQRYQPRDEIEASFRGFIKDEVSAFHKRRYHFYKPSKAAQTRRLQQAGLSFYAAQRQHLSNNEF